jgi:hypothetical protein
MVAAGVGICTACHGPVAAYRVRMIAGCKRSLLKVKLLFMVKAELGVLLPVADRVRLP